MKGEVTGWRNWLVDLQRSSTSSASYQAAQRVDVDRDYSAHRVYLNSQTARDKLIVSNCFWFFFFFFNLSVTFALSDLNNRRYDFVIEMQQLLINIPLTEPISGKIYGKTATLYWPILQRKVNRSGTGLKAVCSRCTRNETNEALILSLVVDWAENTN